MVAWFRHLGIEGDHYSNVFLPVRRDFRLMVKTVRSKHQMVVKLDYPAYQSYPQREDKLAIPSSEQDNSSYDGLQALQGITRVARKQWIYRPRYCLSLQVEDLQIIMGSPIAA